MFHFSSDAAYGGSKAAYLVLEPSLFVSVTFFLCLPILKWSFHTVCVNLWIPHCSHCCSIWSCDDTVPMGTVGKLMWWVSSPWLRAVTFVACLTQLYIISSGLGGLRILLSFVISPGELILSHIIKFPFKPEFSLYVLHEETLFCDKYNVISLSFHYILRLLILMQKPTCVVLGEQGHFGLAVFH